LPNKLGWNAAARPKRISPELTEIEKVHAEDGIDMAKLNRLRKEKHNRDVNAKAALQSKMMKKLKNSFTSKEKKMTEKEMKASMFTTSDKGKLLQRKEPKGDQLA